MDQLILKADINQCEFSGQINTGEVEARILTVEMCDRLCSCAVAFVTFELADGTVYESKVTDGKAKVPMFKKSQFIKIGLYSADIEGGELKKCYSPKPANTHVCMGSYNGNATEPPIPTPSDYAELVEQVVSAKEDTNKAIADLEKGTIKVVTEQVNLWELGTGIYYLNGGWNYTKHLGSSINARHIFVIYKTGVNAVRYIHFCGNDHNDVWNRIGCGFTNGDRHTENYVIDASQVTNNIQGGLLGTQIPSSAGVMNYVKEYVNEQLGVIENGSY